MSERDRLFTIGVGGPVKPLTVYLGWTRGEALADWIVRSAGSLCPEIAAVKEPRVIRALPVCEGFPARWVFEA